MIFNLFKKKPKFKYAVVYAKVADLSKQYMVYDFVNNKRKFVEKGNKKMNKVVDGVELIKMIKDKVFEKGNKIKSLNKGTSYDGEDIEFIWTDENDYKKFAEMSFWTTDELSLLNDFDIEFVIEHKFEILSEEDKEIDIQKDLRELLIEQLTEREHNNADVYMLGKQINVLTRVVKQLDKKIKE